MNVELEVKKQPQEDKKENEVAIAADADGNNTTVSKATQSDEETITNEDDNKRRVRRDRSPIVKKRAVTGTIKWFSVQKGYGFIRRDDIDEDVFMHISALVRQTRLPLALFENQEVEFDIIRGIKGLEATCVSGKNGQRIGTFYDNRMPYRRWRRSEGDFAAAQKNIRGKHEEPQRVKREEPQPEKREEPQQEKHELPQQQKAPNTDGKREGGRNDKPKNKRYNRNYKRGPPKSAAKKDESHSVVGDNKEQPKEANKAV